MPEEYCVSNEMKCSKTKPRCTYDPDFCAELNKKKVNLDLEAFGTFKEQSVSRDPISSET